MASAKLEIEALLAESEREVARYAWDGTFADYLRMVRDDPSVSRLSHKLVYDAVVAQGVTQSPTGEPEYGLFKGEIFGMDASLRNIIHYFSSAARRLEIRKRILLLLGPPASGKSSVVALLKRALERYTCSSEGTVYGIKGCPMQEEPLHLIPHELRGKILDDHGIYIEGELCPRCRYVLRKEYAGKISQMPVTRVVFSEHEALGIGYYVATNPNPSDASLLVGSVDTSQLEGDRQEVAGKAFRLDGEFNVANRGLMELVEIFKADGHLLTALLGLAQEQMIKMERFGSVFADEVIVGHSNEADFNEFKADVRSEALKDRIIEIRIPYNLRVSDEVKISDKVLKNSGLEDVHIPPLTLPTMAVFAVLSRLEHPMGQGMTKLDKLRIYDGQVVQPYNMESAQELYRQHPDEGMNGISPRYVMNRLSAVSSAPEVTCVSPLKALDSLWEGLKENVGLEVDDRFEHVELVKYTVEEYGQRAIREVQRAFEERFEQTAKELLSDYLENLEAYHTQGPDDRGAERSMREMEKHLRITERARAKFRDEIHKFFGNLKRRGVAYDYTTEPRMKAAVEARLFPDPRRLQVALSQPRFARRQAEWARRRGAIYNRLIQSYGYCPECANDIIDYVVHVIRGGAVVKTPHGEAVEWLWDLSPEPPPPSDSDSD